MCSFEDVLSILAHDHSYSVHKIENVEVARSSVKESTDKEPHQPYMSPQYQNRKLLNVYSRTPLARAKDADRSNRLMRMPQSASFETCL